MLTSPRLQQHWIPQVSWCLSVSSFWGFPSVLLMSNRPWSRRICRPQHKLGDCCWDHRWSRRRPCRRYACDEDNDDEPHCSVGYSAVDWLLELLNDLDVAVFPREQYTLASKSSELSVTDSLSYWSSFEPKPDDWIFSFHRLGYVERWLACSRRAHPLIQVYLGEIVSYVAIDHVADDGLRKHALSWTKPSCESAQGHWVLSGLRVIHPRIRVIISWLSVSFSAKSPPWMYWDKPMKPSWISFCSHGLDQLITWAFLIDR